jgi:23S rRNA (cytosine1962-C5)-methyltransferase
LSLSEFQEDGVYYAADFLEGQKTGFFLDQKENRKFLRSKAQGQNVLDLCCYSGGWGLSALAGGAAAVTFVDQSAEALELARKGLLANQLQAKSGFHSEQKTEFFQADVFEFLESAVKQNRKFDIVVADPPAFVKSKKNLPQAIKAYEKLNRLALEVLNPGGLLLTCSCSFHLSETDFFNLLLRAAGEERRPLQVVYRAGASTDHPWILQRPETNYLKCLALR